MKRDLIVFGEDWGALPSSTQHLIRHLSRERQVLWVNSIGLRRPRLTVFDLRRLWRKTRTLLPGSRGIADPGVRAPFPVLSPHVLPLPGHPVARLWIRRVLSRQVARAAARHGIRAPVLWLSLPTAVDVVGTLGEHAVVYYCGDDFGALAGVDHAPVVRLERELLERADLVLAVSPRLVTRFPEAKTRLLPHGVDFDLFATPVAPASDLPVPGPVAGFYGSVADWIDTDLLADVAKRLPGWRFLLIGEIKTDVSALRNLSNVTLAGARPHTSLPSYSQHWTVSLLPFRDNDQIRASNPLKLREYLAAGRPVVTTDFPALEGCRDLVSIAADPEAFAVALEQARLQPNERCQARRARMAGEAWPARAAEASALIDALG